MADASAFQERPTTPMTPEMRAAILRMEDFKAGLMKRLHALPPEATVRVAVAFRALVDDPAIFGGAKRMDVPAFDLLEAMTLHAERRFGYVGPVGNIGGIEMPMPDEVAP